jgi:hypothetical protein
MGEGGSNKRGMALIIDESSFVGLLFYSGCSRLLLPRWRTASK